jgi:predicted dehydrogenase
MQVEHRAEAPTKPLRFVQVGTGGFGKYWCSDVFPYLFRTGKAEVVAAVDIVSEQLANAREFLGLREEQCYTDLGKALAENEADAVAVVVPPAHHEDVVDAGLAHGLHILSEKPIADTMTGCCRIASKVQAADRRMAVTMSHRFDQDKQSLKAQLASGVYGPIHYLVHRFTHNCRAFGSWGEFRHRIADPLLVEGAVHHFDIHRELAGSNAATIYVRSWNPAWGEYAGDSTAIAIIEMVNGIRVLYEGAKANACTLNGWGNDYLRVECELGTLELDRRQLRVLRSDTGGLRSIEELPLVAGNTWMNPLLAEMFCDWVDGRREDHPTSVDDNLQCAAMVFAAVESAHTGGPVQVQEFLERHLKLAEALEHAVATSASSADK